MGVLEQNADVRFIRNLIYGLCGSLGLLNHGFPVTYFFPIKKKIKSCGFFSLNGSSKTPKGKNVCWGQYSH